MITCDVRPVSNRLEIDRRWRSHRDPEQSSFAGALAGQARHAEGRLECPEEEFGGALMAWWEGQGAARVLARQGNAILLERATGKISLAELARRGRDVEATRIICAATAKLHAPRAQPLSNLVPLSQWFGDLEPAAAIHGGVFSLAAETARELLAHPRDVGVLHGDINHDNILDFEDRGWFAIDSKGLFAERGFDYANLFCNPDLAVPIHPAATAPGLFERRIEVLSEAAGLDRRRLLQWILAWTGLLAAWLLSDREAPSSTCGSPSWRWQSCIAEDARWAAWAGLAGFAEVPVMLDNGL
jgi:streptomycin 6-kinase